MSEPGKHYMHPLLRVQVEEWRRQAGVDSATPSAPVVDDRRGPFRWSRWWRSLFELVDTRGPALPVLPDSCTYQNSGGTS